MRSSFLIINFDFESLFLLFSICETVVAWHSTNYCQYKNDCGQNLDDKFNEFDV